MEQVGIGKLFRGRFQGMLSGTRPLVLVLNAVG